MLNERHPYIVRVSAIVVNELTFGDKTVRQARNYLPALSIGGFSPAEDG